MLRKITPVFLLFFLAGYCLYAQSEDRHLTAPSPFFIDADLGAFIVLSDYGAGMTQASLAAGYRFNERHAVGLEHRRGLLGEAYTNSRAVLLGPVYRYTLGGLYLRGAFGVALNSTYDYSESLAEWDQRGLGAYQNLTLGYRFRFGMFVGVSATLVRRTLNRRFYELTPEYEDLWQLEYYDISELPPGAGNWRADGREANSFPIGTLTVGYAFPGRKTAK